MADWLKRVIGVGVAGMGAAAVVFWVATWTMGGTAAVVNAIGQTAMALFTMAHLPSMAGAILLWRAGVGVGQPALRGALGVVMIYFSAACIIAFFGNFLAASVLGMLNRGG